MDRCERSDGFGDPRDQKSREWSFPQRREFLATYYRARSSNSFVSIRFRCSVSSFKRKSTRMSGKKPEIITSHSKTQSPSTAATRILLFSWSVSVPSRLELGLAPHARWEGLHGAQMCSFPNCVITNMNQLKGEDFPPRSSHAFGDSLPSKT